MEFAANNGMEAFQSVRQFLGKGDWDAEEIPGQYTFKATAEGELCPQVYYFQIKVELGQFLFYIVPVITLLPDMFPAVAEFIARANFGMRIGNFELDYEGCQVMVRSSINFKGVPLSETLIEGVISPALEAYKEFFPGLAQVIAGTNTPSHAIRVIEYGE